VKIGTVKFLYSYCKQNILTQKIYKLKVIGIVRIFRLRSLEPNRITKGYFELL